MSGRMTLLAVAGAIGAGWYIVTSWLWLAILLGVLSGAVYAVLVGVIAGTFPEVPRPLVWVGVAGVYLAAGTWLVKPWVGYVLAVGWILAAGVTAVLTDIARPRSTPPTSTPGPVITGAPGDVTWAADTEWAADAGAEIDRDGWTVFAARTELHLLATCADPGNPGRPLTLYSLPARYGPHNVVEAWDGTPGPDGIPDRLACVVPDTCTTPVDAIAWTYGVPAEVYAATTRRT